MSKLEEFNKLAQELENKIAVEKDPIQKQKLEDELMTLEIGALFTPPSEEECEGEDEYEEDYYYNEYDIEFYDEECNVCRGGGCVHCEPWRFI